VSAVLAAAGYPASSHHRDTGWGEGFRLHPQSDGSVLIGHEAIAEDTGGVVAATGRAQHMIARYTRTLQDAGYQVTTPAPGSLTVTPQPGGRQAWPAVSPEQARQANHAALAADEAYRAGQFDRARQLIGRAAELDPGRAGLWDQHRAEITAKQLFTQATAARAAGDHTRAKDLLGQCRELDPRLDSGWHRHLTGIRNGHVTHKAATPAEGRAAGHGQQHERSAPPRARERATSRETVPRSPASPARSGNPVATGGRGGTQPDNAGRGNQVAPAAAAEPGQQRARHSWEPVGEGTKRCTRDGCGLQATQRPHPTEQRWLTTYTKDGRTVVAARVPACGQDLPQGASAEQMQHLATEADRQAGLAFRSGDIDRAYRLLTDARALDPGRQQLWDIREQQIRAHVAAGQPRQVSHSTEEAPCPHCGSPYVRPAGETYPCLSCQTQARLTAAGLTAGSPEIKQVAEWNRATARRADRQQETPQPQPEAETGHGPQVTAGAGPVPGEAKDPGREREATG
jgi:tetratricopeptide (TPR) repeat protein